MTDEKKQQWHQWLEQDPFNQLAWQRVEALQNNLASIPGDIVSPTLQGAELSRRELIQRLGIVILAFPVGLTAWQYKPWQRWQGQYTTAIGEQLHLTLTDGSKLILNTSTNVDVEFNHQRRQIKMYRGEIFVETAIDHQSPMRPFFVDTPQGLVEALGTKFTVRIEEEHTQVQVIEKQVRTQPEHSHASKIIGQGQQVYFSTDGISAVESVSPWTDTWVKGSLAVVDMPLKTLLKELSRYHKGYLSCSAEIADLKISGAFPIDDIEKSLNVITHSFPIKQIRISRFWIRLISV